MANRTFLFGIYEKYNAKIVDFAGWELPIHFGSQLDEHHQVRNDCGIFDVSHMTVVDVEGHDAKAFLKNLLANDVSKLKEPGQALYSALLNEDGGILDDLIVYWCGDDSYRVVVNAATKDKDLAWFNEQSANYTDLLIQWRSDLSMIAVQGPNAVKVLANSHENLANVGELSVFHSIKQDPFFVARTGYTGEDGFEVILSSKYAAEFWDLLVSAGAKPCGLGARDTLRLEAGMNLYGTDMTEDNHPYESNMGWTVSMTEGREFIGKSALQSIKPGNQWVLRGLVVEGKGIPRAGQSVLVDGVEVGTVTSGTFSPTLKQGIAMARIDKSVGDSCQIQIRKNAVDARVIKPVFVRNGKSQI